MRTSCSTENKAGASSFPTLTQDWPGCNTEIQYINKYYATCKVTTILSGHCTNRMCYATLSTDVCSQKARDDVQGKCQMPNDMIKGDCPNGDNVARPSPHRRVTLLQLLLVSNIIYEDIFLSLGSCNTHTHTLCTYTHI